MAAGKSIEDILSGAKAELSKANAFSTSVKGEIPSPPASTTKHEYSSAPYSLVKPKSPSLGDELKEKGRMVSNAKKALEQ